MKALVGCETLRRSVESFSSAAAVVQHPPEHVRLEDQEVDAAEDRGHDQDEGHADGALALGQVPLPPTEDPTRLDHPHSGHQ